MPLLLAGAGLIAFSVQANEPFDARAWVRAGHGGTVNSVAVSPDGQWIASASDDATVKLWRTSDGTLARTLTDSLFQASAVAFSPADNVLGAGLYDGSARLWNYTNGTLTRKLSVVWTNTEIGRAYTNLSGKVGAIAFSPDGQRLVSGSADWFTRVWRVSDGARLNNLVKHRGGVTSAAYSPDGTRLALGSEDKTVLVLRTSDWANVRTNVLGSNVTAVAYSPQGTLLAASGLDRTIRLWRTSDWGLAAAMTNDTGSATCLAFSTNGQTLFAGDQAGLLKAWSAAAGWSVVLSWTGHVGAVFSLAVTPDSAALVSGGADHQVNLWQTADGTLLRKFTGHSGRITQTIHSPDGMMVAAASDDGTIGLWSAASGALVRTLAGHTNQVSAMAFAPDATVLVSGGGCLDNTIRIWRCSDGALLRMVPAHTNGVEALAFSADLLRVASAGDRDERVIRLWNPADGTLLGTLAGDTDGTAVLAFSPDGSVLASGARLNAGRVALWDPAGGSSNVLGGHIGGVQSTAFNATGTLVASAGRKDNLVKVWQTADGTLVATLTDLAEGARAVAFSPDGAILAAGGTDRVQFWQTANWQPAWSYTNELFRISALSFSPNGTFFVMGREDGTVGRLWNPQASAVTLGLGIATDGVAGAPRLAIDNPGYSPFLAVENSADLFSWGQWTNVLGRGRAQVLVTDLTAAGMPVRFYRVSTPE